MRQVLRRLGFLNEQGIVTQKGQVACEISSADELVATTLLYEGVTLLSRNNKPVSEHFRKFSFFEFQRHYSVIFTVLAPQMKIYFLNLKIGTFLPWIFAAFSDFYRLSLSHHKRALLFLQQVRLLRLPTRSF